MASMSTLYRDGSAPMAERTLRATSAEVSFPFGNAILDIANQSQSILTHDWNDAGLFAGTIGVQRLLKLFAKYNMKTTWFIPGHSLETFPEDMAAVRDAGHEIGLHGYSHENPSDMTIEQQRDVLDKTYRMLTDFVGKPPRGSVAPW